MAEVRLSSPVPAKYHKILPETAEAGAFTYYTDKFNQIAGMIYVCPCGCGARGTLRFGKKKPSPKPNQATWDWNSNLLQPTLHSSIHHVGHWHGWLTNGMFLQN